MSLRIMS